MGTAGQALTILHHDCGAVLNQYPNRSFEIHLEGLLEIRLLSLMR
jgi:hypothetical protein